MSMGRGHCFETSRPLIPSPPRPLGYRERSALSLSDRVGDWRHRSEPPLTFPPSSDAVYRKSHFMPRSRWLLASQQRHYLAYSMRVIYERCAVILNSEMS